jgi:protein SCO1/2
MCAGGLLVAVVAGTGCARREGGQANTGTAETQPFGLRGQVLPAALAKPDVVLTDTRRAPFDLRRETHGYLTLLYFGYTSCPDVCPIHMANLSAVLRDLRPSLRERIKVVFVTTDPARDTPERLRSWLDNFDKSFIGLTGDTATINTAQRALYLPLPEVGPSDSAGEYEVGHAAAVVAFTPDDSARVMYPFGIRQEDWANDLPKLLEIRWAR